MRSGSRPRPEGTRLLFAGGTVSPIMCPAESDEQHKDDKKGPTKYKATRDRKRTKTNNSRPQRGGGVLLKCLPTVSGWSGVIWHDIYRDISWYNIPHHAISQDTRYRDIVSISRTLRTDIEISHPVEIFLDTRTLVQKISVYGSYSFIVRKVRVHSTSRNQCTCFCGLPATYTLHTSL